MAREVQNLKDIFLLESRLNLHSIGLEPWLVYTICIPFPIFWGGKDINQQYQTYAGEIYRNPVEVQNLSQMVTPTCNVYWPIKLTHQGGVWIQTGSLSHHRIHVYLYVHITLYGKRNACKTILYVEVIFRKSSNFFNGMLVLLGACHSPEGCFAHPFDFLWALTPTFFLK